MQSLVIQHNDNLVTALQKVAEETSSNVASMQKLIRTHRERLESFGAIEFEEIEVRGKTGSTKRKQYYLNEQQSYLFITFLKNTPAVLDFKERLIKEFFEMKQRLNQQALPKQPDPYIYQLERENIELKRAINRITQNPEIDKLKAQNKKLKQTLVDIKDRYHKIVQKADNQIEAMRKELSLITTHFQFIPNIAEDGKNLNTDTLSKRMYWSQT